MRVQKMSEAELEVMRAVWRCGGAVTSPFLHEVLSETRAWKQNTVITFLSRLADKGLIRAEKAGRGKPSRYVALVTEEAYKRLETMDFLQEVHGGDLGSLMTALCGDERPSPQRLAELRDWFDTQMRG